MRSAAPVDAGEIDARVAEKLVRAALNPDIEADVDPEMGGTVQGMAIMHIFGEGRASEQEIDAVLVEAVAAANRVSG